MSLLIHVVLLMFNDTLLSFNHPCLDACEDQVHKFLVTHASYPNEDPFTETLAFCLLLKKLVSS